MDERIGHEEAFPRLSNELLAVLERVGSRRALAEGEVLHRAGDRSSHFYAVVRGLVVAVEDFGRATEREIVVLGERRFTGELNLMTGQPGYLTTLVREEGEAIALSRDQLRGVIAANQQLGDVILSALIARRAILIGLGAGLRLIGSSLSPDCRRLREFLTRNRIPHGFVDVETDEPAERLLRELAITPQETPVVLRGALTLRNPSDQELAQALNLRPPSAPGRLFDTVVIGAGPAGLGAAVYAASEGLSAVLVDSVAIGGQASTSSRIDNYLGFPAGISGSELAERAAVQAARFGAGRAVPVTARALSLENGYHVVEFEDDERLLARTVVVATGASYRRLNVARLTEFEGAGVYHAATEVEAQMCRGDPWSSSAAPTQRARPRSFSPAASATSTWSSGAATWLRACRAT